MNAHDNTPDVSIVVPVYRSAEVLDALVTRIFAALPDRSVEVVLVNDNSPDSSWQVMRELSRSDPRVRSIDLLNNHGQAVATMCGLSYSRAPIVVTMDDDLEHPPEEIPKLLSALANDAELDAVVGSWDRDRSLFRNFGSYVYEALDRVAWNTPKGFRHSAFRAIRRPAVDALLGHETQNPRLSPLLLEVAGRVINVEVDHTDRTEGASGFHFRDSVNIATTHFIYGSTLPLRLLARFGSFMAAASLAFGAYLIVRSLFGTDRPTGWLSVFVAVIFFGGMSLFGIGMLGRYIAVIITEVRRSPRWTVRETFPE